VAAMPLRRSLKSSKNLSCGKPKAFRTGCGQAAKSHTLPRCGTDFMRLR